jgi:hypothetical protein
VASAGGGAHPARDGTRPPAAGPIRRGVGCRALASPTATDKIAALRGAPPLETPGCPPRRPAATERLAIAAGAGSRRRAGPVPGRGPGPPQGCSLRRSTGSLITRLAAAAVSAPRIRSRAARDRRRGARSRRRWRRSTWTGSPAGASCSASGQRPRPVARRSAPLSTSPRPPARDRRRPAHRTARTAGCLRGPLVPGGFRRAPADAASVRERSRSDRAPRSRCALAAETLTVKGHPTWSLDWPWSASSPTCARG